MQDGARGEASVVAGGCQCGAVRYVIASAVADWDANVCHCRMCQKASGGPFMAFVNVPRGSVAWTGERAQFASSSIATRGYCRDCGTPLTYERTPDRISISHGSLDDPTIVDPTSQLVGSTVLPWSMAVADMPRHSLDDWVSGLDAPIQSRQHPDRDT